jgi:hypothetical protein
MQYMLIDYVKETGWHKLAREEQQRWLGAYRAYMEAMKTAGVLKDSAGLHPPSTATTVRVEEQKTLVMDGPYADTKEQLGGFHLIEVPDLDAALAWAARSPTALHGVVEVRQVMEDTMLTAIGARSSTPHSDPAQAPIHPVNRNQNQERSIPDLLSSITSRWTDTSPTPTTP